MNIEEVLQSPHVWKLTPKGVKKVIGPFVKTGMMSLHVAPIGTRAYMSPDDLYPTEISAWEALLDKKARIASEAEKKLDHANANYDYVIAAYEKASKRGFKV